MGRKCRRHHWRLPVVGDDALECETCGRRLPFLHDMTPDKRAAIAASHEKRCGPESGAAFRVALDAAIEDARTRHETPAFLASFKPVCNPAAGTS